MGILDRLTEDMKSAMRAKETVRLSAIRMALNTIKGREKEGKKELSEEELEGVIASDIKKRKEALDQFRQGGREDLVAAEEEAIGHLLVYLPEQMGEEEVARLVGDAVIETGASSMKDIGAVMKIIMPKVKGKADGALVNRLVKERLAG